jgi:hypothetical protein
MSKTRSWTAMAACLCVSGCAGYTEQAAISNDYMGLPVVSYTDSSGVWRISDRPDEGRMKIGPNLSRTIAASFGPEVTFVPPSRRETAVAAERWLASTGRRCVVGAASPVVNQQWEFQYSCG